MLGQKTALSGSLMVVARLISRVIDLFTMLVFARLLSPTDFGLVAIAATIVLIIEAAMELPLSQALVRLPVIEETYYDTAFTLGLLRGAILCGLVCGLAFPFARFYHQPELGPLICVLSVAPAARGMLNPRMAQYAKDLNFKWEFLFELVGKVTAFVAGALVAVLTRSYWSIAVCTVTAPIVIAALSYYLVSFRPRLTLSAWRVFKDFLGWISLSQVILAINWQSDQLLLGKIMRPAQLGLFSTANNLANIPMLALFSPILRPLLSAFTMLRDEPARLRSSYQSAAAAVVTIGLPLMVGESLVAGPAVRLMLGAKWLGAIPMLYWLALSLVPTLFAVVITPLGMALNETKQLAWRNAFQMCVKLPLVIAGALMFGFFGVIIARLISEAITAVYCMVVVRRLIGISMADQINNFVRPVVSAVVMAGLLMLATPWFAWGNSTVMLFAELAASIALGAAAYCGTLALLWSLAGRPAGVEATCLRMLEQFARRFTKLSAEAKTS